MEWTAELLQYQLLIVFFQKTIEIDISEIVIKSCELSIFLKSNNKYQPSWQI